MFYKNIDTKTFIVAGRKSSILYHLYRMLYKTEILLRLYVSLYVYYNWNNGREFSDTFSLVFLLNSISSFCSVAAAARAVGI